MAQQFTVDFRRCRWMPTLSARYSSRLALFSAAIAGAKEEAFLALRDAGIPVIGHRHLDGSSPHRVKWSTYRTGREHHRKVWRVAQMAATPKHSPPKQRHGLLPTSRTCGNTTTTVPVR